MVENYRQAHPAKQSSTFNKQTHTISGKVVNVADGDTLTILNAENKQTKICLYGIDAPEKAQNFGNVSREHLAGLVSGKTIEVTVVDVDQYSRSVGRIKVDGKEVTEEMLKAGMGWVYTAYCKIPECKHWEKLETQAKTAKIGLWSNPTAKGPWLCGGKSINKRFKVFQKIRRNRMNEIWQTVTAFIVSIGGASAIIWVIVRKSCDILAERISKKYEQKLAEELEKYKATLERQIYISQKHFDLKLNIYRELTSGIMDMTQATYLLFPPADELPADPKEEKQEWIQRYNDASRKYNAVADIVFKNAPFVEHEIYNLAVQIRKECLAQLCCFASYRLEEDYYGRISHEQYAEVSKRTKEIICMRDKLVEDIRNTLHKLQTQIQ